MINIAYILSDTFFFQFPLQKKCIWPQTQMSPNKIYSGFHYVKNNISLGMHEELIINGNSPNFVKLSQPRTYYNIGHHM